VPPVLRRGLLARRCLGRKSSTDRRLVPAAKSGADLSPLVGRLETRAAATGEAGLDEPALDRAPGEPRMDGLAHAWGSGLASVAAKPLARLAIHLDSSGPHLGIPPQKSSRVPGTCVPRGGRRGPAPAPSRLDRRLPASRDPFGSICSCRFAPFASPPGKQKGPFPGPFWGPH
jgi:hypothetical protein